MKKIFLILSLFVSSFVFAEVRNSLEYQKGDIYEVCSDYKLFMLIGCSNVYLLNGFKAQSGLHAIQTPEGILFYQAFIKI